MAGTHPTIGGKIRALREAKELTTRALGELVGYSASQISKWERGGADPDWEQTCRLAKALGVPPRLLWDPDPLTVDPSGVSRGRAPIMHDRG